MTDYISRASLKVANELADFIETKALVGLGVDSEEFWNNAAEIFEQFSPLNKQLLAKRDDLQRQIDEWHSERRNKQFSPDQYRSFLQEIGYLTPPPASFAITTENVDTELATLAGPQLVVPVLNARYALNAANARWGSLYDALYGTDAIPQTGSEKPGYDPARGAKVIDTAKAFLDKVVPLESGSHADVSAYSVENGALNPALKNPDCFAGYTGAPEEPDAILLRHNGLHLEIKIDRAHPVGRDDSAGVADVLLEAALSTIVDLEDSVAAVDAEDKVVAYSNWLGLMQGDLTSTFEKAGENVNRGLNA